jgi:hypothetical protein
MPALRIVSVLCCALLTATAHGQSAPPASIGWGSWLRPTPPLAVSNTPHPSVARIMVQERDGIAFGSGTLVDVQGDQGLVITNWHVVRDASGDIEVSFPDGYRSKAKVLKMDRDWDLAVLVIWKPTAPPVALSATAPQPGEVLTIAGYGSGNFRAATAKCTQYVSPGRSLPYEMVEVGTEARQGDSGGPILNQRGEIAGVLFGAGGGTTSGSYVGRVRTFLATVSPRLSDPANVTVPENLASTNPFLNPNGVAPRLVHEANIKAPGPEDKPVTEGWHAARGKKADVVVNDMQPVLNAPPRVASPPARFASRGADITFGTLPSTTAAEATEEKRPEDDAAMTLWHRPLPVPVAAPEASAKDAASVLQAAGPIQGELWQSILGATLLDQGKSLFAAIGVLAIVIRCLRSPSA